MAANRRDDKRIDALERLRGALADVEHNDRHKMSLTKADLVAVLSLYDDAVHAKRSAKAAKARSETEILGLTTTIARFDAKIHLIWSRLLEIEAKISGLHKKKTILSPDREALLVLRRELAYLRVLLIGKADTPDPKLD